MAKTIDFRIKGDDPSMGHLRGMLNGIANQMGDHSLKFQETRIVSVTTERDDVADILVKISKANQPAAAQPAPARRGRKPKKVEVTDGE